MPRDDLSIDFIKKGMPLEALDPAQILDDWTNRVANLPEEMRFLEEEITSRDKRIAEHLKTIEDRDGRIQKWIKANGSHEHNPREEGYRQTIRDNYAQADALSLEKLKLTERMKLIVDKHVRQLDMQIKMLYDRGEPGFTEPDEVPSLLRPSAANHSNPMSRMVNPAANPASASLQPILSATTGQGARANPPSRAAQQQHQQHPSTTSSTPAAAAALLVNRVARETSAGVGGSGGGAHKKGPRHNMSLGSIPTTSSGIARHSSLGPGTPKAHIAAGIQRAGSAGPRASTKASSVSGRKSGSAGLASAAARKKGNSSTKSGLSRVKRAAKNSGSSNAGSEVSDADSGSDHDSDVATAGGRATPVGRSSSQLDSQPAAAAAAAASAGVAHLNSKRNHHHNNNSSNNEEIDDMMDLDDDEAGDDRKYCLCQNVSFGDMVACDNDACPYEWFHWSCVGLKSEPTGKWYCRKACRDAARDGSS